MTPAPEKAEKGTLAWRLSRLQEAVDTGRAELEPHPVMRARRTLEKVSRRSSFPGHHCVVALAGATGSGKSTLFNTLVGSPVAEIGARRPTTSKPAAAIWGQSIPHGLMDWLHVTQRHYVKGSSPDDTAFPLVNWPVKGFRKMPWGRPGFDKIARRQAEPQPIEALDGLVLLDLPDFDSRVGSHRKEADRLLEMVDMFVWVTDPQKYADARLHEDYLRTMRDLDKVMIVVLNQVDRLPAGEVQRCTQHLRTLLAEDGHPEIEVLTTSAYTQHGLDTLRQRIADEVMTRTLPERRLTGDLMVAARDLEPGIGETEPDPDADQVRGDLVGALSRAAAVPAVLQAVELDYMRSAHASSGWLFTRWSRHMRPDPLKRLRLKEDQPGIAGITKADVSQVLGRSSLPPATPAARAAVEIAAQELGDRASKGLPPRWAASVHEAAAPPQGDLTDALDLAVRKTSLRAKAPAWWGVFNLFQWVFGILAVGAGLWYLAILVLQAMAIRVPGTPYVGPIPVPLLVFVDAVLAGVLLAALGRALARGGARKRRRLVEKRLTESVSQVAEEQFVEPVRAVLDRHRRVRRGVRDVLS